LRVSHEIGADCLFDICFLHGVARQGPRPRAFLLLNNILCSCFLFCHMLLRGGRRARRALRRTPKITPTNLKKTQGPVVHSEIRRSRYVVGGIFVRVIGGGSHRDNLKTYLLSFPYLLVFVWKCLESMFNHFRCNKLPEAAKPSRTAGNLPTLQQTKRQIAKLKNTALQIRKNNSKLTMTKSHARVSAAGGCRPTPGHSPQCL
jgi:hypothetical protein